MFKRKKNKNSHLGKKYYVVDPHANAVWEYPAESVNEAMKFLSQNIPGCFVAEAWNLADLVCWHQDVFKGFHDIAFESHDRGYGVHHLSRSDDGTVSLATKCCMSA